MLEMLSRKVILKTAENNFIKNLVIKNGFTESGGFARRFIAGETLDEAVENALQLNSEGIATSITLLGEYVADFAEVDEILKVKLQILETIKKKKINSHISIKLTHFGLGLDKEECYKRAVILLKKASEYGVFIRLDMESSEYTVDTFDILYRLHKEFGPMIGTAIQTYLYRTESDVRKLIAENVKVRLVKGAYLEPESISFSKKYLTDLNYIKCMELLLQNGNFPAIATHDEKMIELAKKLIANYGKSKEDFEFQMIYGVRRDLQKQIVKDGYNLRVTIPYGKEWYPYYTRRLGERIGNITFILKSMYLEQEESNLI